MKGINLSTKLNEIKHIEPATKAQCVQQEVSRFMLMIYLFIYLMYMSNFYIFIYRLDLHVNKPYVFNSNNLSL